MGRTPHERKPNRGTAKRIRLPGVDRDFSPSLIRIEYILERVSLNYINFSQYCQVTGGMSFPAVKAPSFPIGRREKSPCGQARGSETLYIPVRYSTPYQSPYNISPTPDSLTPEIQRFFDERNDNTCKVQRRPIHAQQRQDASPEKMELQIPPENTHDNGCGFTI